MRRGHDVRGNRIGEVEFAKGLITNGPSMYDRSPRVVCGSDAGSRDMFVGRNLKALKSNGAPTWRMKHEAEQCVICLQDMKVVNLRRTKSVGPKQSGCKRLKCKHIFHTACIKRWATRSAECPCCRATLLFWRHGRYYQHLMMAYELQRALRKKHVREMLMKAYVSCHGHGCMPSEKWWWFEPGHDVVRTVRSKIQATHACSWHDRRNTSDTPIHHFGVRS